MPITKKSAARKNFKSKAKAYVKKTTPGAGKKVVRKLSKSIRKSAQAAQGPKKASARKTKASERKLLKGMSVYNSKMNKKTTKTNSSKPKASGQYSRSRVISGSKAKGSRAKRG